MPSDGSCQPGILPVGIALLGSPAVTAADGSRQFALPRRTLDVLAYLILHRRRAPTRAAVAFTLFADDDEEAARGNLRRNLSQLLNALPESNGEPFVVVDGEYLSWNPHAPAVIDIDVFEEAIADGRDEIAIAAYGGELLPTLYDDWTATDRERLRTAFHGALDRTIERERSRRRFDLAIAAAKRLLADDQWREDVVRRLIAIRYEAGDRAGALAEYEDFARALNTEMQVEPMPETIALRAAVPRGASPSTSEPARASNRTASSAPGLPFAGRDDELAAACERWHDAADGRPGVLVVAGEAGVGKSRFAAELARVVEREGGRVIRGETSAGGEHRPYEAFIDALREALVGRGRTPARRHSDEVWPAVVDELLDDLPGSTLVDDRASRVRLFHAIARTFADLARSRPLTVVLEDLHWAGGDTINLLDHIAERLGRAPVLFVVTMRNDELAHAHPLRTLVPYIESRGNGMLITLGRLDAAHAQRTLREALPATVADDAVSRAVVWADGVPLLLTAAFTELLGGRELPAGDVDDLVGQRFARVAPATETAIVYGAMIGARFDIATLAAVTGWTNDVLTGALTQAMELGLVRVDGVARGLTYAFTHHLIHLAAFERVAPDERALLHGIIARTLQMSANGAGSRANEVARQFQAANEPALAAAAYADAARYALSIFANDDARTAATAGLAVAGDDSGMRYDLLATREHALRRLGAPEARREDARALVSDAGDDKERRVAALARMFEAYRDDADVRAEALRELGELASDNETAGAVYARACATHAFLDGAYAQARDAALDAAGRFAQLGDERESVFARLQHISVLGRLGAFAECDAAIADLRPRAEASGDLALRAEFHRAASSAASDANFEQQFADAERSLDLALRIGDRLAEARARQNVAFFLGRNRKYDQALREQQAALAAFNDAGDQLGAFDMRMNLAALRTWCGDHATALELADAARATSPPTPWATLRLALIDGVIALGQERFDDGEAVLLSARSVAISLGAELHVARADGLRAEICARSGRGEQALALLEPTIAALWSLGQPARRAELLALSAHVHADAGDATAARDAAVAAVDAMQHARPQGFSEAAWHLAAATALIGDDAGAETFARRAAAAFADDAQAMSADLIDNYARLPWHRYACDYLAGRIVPLRFSAGLCAPTGNYGAAGDDKCAADNDRQRWARLKGDKVDELGHKEKDHHINSE
jgi:DNA-binding SARP family transcriptional activator